VIGGRTLHFITEKTACLVRWNELEIPLKYIEMPRMEHYLFPRIKRMVPEVPDDRTKAIKASDVAIRLSLAFPGDYVLVVRDILYLGAGAQTSAMIFKVF
jgi:hypothetical protein